MICYCKIISYLKINLNLYCYYYLLKRFIQIDLICKEVEERLQFYKECRNLQFFDEIMRVSVDDVGSLKEISYINEDIRGINFEDPLVFSKLKLLGIKQ